VPHILKYESWPTHSFNERLSWVILNQRLLH